MKNGPPRQLKNGPFITDNIVKKAIFKNDKYGK
ncbi:MAG: hypothetical protein ACI8YQ_004127, partial [Polaribacter sp.]